MRAQTGRLTSEGGPKGADRTNPPIPRSGSGSQSGPGLHTVPTPAARHPQNLSSPPRGGTAPGDPADPLSGFQLSSVPVSPRPFPCCFFLWKKPLSFVNVYIQKCPPRLSVSERAWGTLYSLAHCIQFSLVYLHFG